MKSATRKGIETVRMAMATATPAERAEIEAALRKLLAPQKTAPLFEEEVLAAAREVVEPGMDRAFISRTYDVVATRRPGLTLDAFKAQVLAMHRTLGVVRLSRCDLTAAFDAHEQARSETAYLSATFHFIRLT